jgi:parallel beta-helix repeat protein
MGGTLTNVSITGNTISGATLYGINIGGAPTRPTISSNRINCGSSTATGIYFSAGSAGPTISGNTIDGCYNGINLGGSTVSVVNGNQIYGYNSAGGLGISGGNYSIISGNHLDMFQTAIKETSSGTHITGNLIDNNNSGGMSSASVASSCTGVTATNTVGVCINGDVTTITGNRFFNFAYPVYTTSGSQVSSGTAEGNTANPNPSGGKLIYDTYGAFTHSANLYWIPFNYYGCDYTYHYGATYGRIEWWSNDCWSINSLYSYPSVALTTQGNPVKIRVNGSGYVGTAGVYMYIRVVDASNGNAVVGYPDHRQFFNTASQHMPWGFEEIVTGLAPGLHTFQLQWRAQGNYYVYMDSGDQLSITVEELNH